MDLHVIVGAGPIGTATATLLAREGYSVRVVSRSGRGPTLPGVRRIAADAMDSTVISGLADGAVAIYNCANPPYQRWTTDWPPLAASMLSSAERTGAVLVTMSNLYGYGPVDRPMRESDPLAAIGRKGRIRASMWTRALAAHQAGRARVVEARASDYFGPGVLETSHLGERVVPNVLSGRPVRLVGDPDAPHTWTYVPDIAHALVTLAMDERAWGRAWHVPSNSPLSQRAVIQMMADLAGMPVPEVRSAPLWMLRAGGVFSPVLRELVEVYYQFDRPFIMDSSAFTSTFGQRPTPMEEALSATVEWWRERVEVAA